MNIQIILNKENGTIDILYNGYNIIKKTIYNDELTNKILELLENELKQDEFNFENFEQFLKMK